MSRNKIIIIFFVLIVLMALLASFIVKRVVFTEQDIEATTSVEDIIDPSEWFVVDTEPVQETEPQLPILFNEEFEQKWKDSAIFMAKTIWGEACGVNAEEQEKVAWCILNRVDDSRFPNTIIKVITAPNQFHGYNSKFPCTDEMYALSLEVIYKWQLEKMGVEVDRKLDSDYLYFHSDKTGLGNVFKKTWGRK